MCPLSLPGLVWGDEKPQGARPTFRPCSAAHDSHLVIRGGWGGCISAVVRLTRQPRVFEPRTPPGPPLVKGGRSGSPASVTEGRSGSPTSHEGEKKAPEQWLSVTRGLSATKRLSATSTAPPRDPSHAFQRRRFIIPGLACLAILAGPGADQGKTPELVTLSGKVVTLAEALQPRGMAVDAQPAGSQVVLQAADGSIAPLLSDEASRALFQDPRLRNRQAELKARRFTGLPYVQVVSFKVDESGRLRTPEYYCEICTISVRYLQDCPCCQGPMELRMKPDAP